MKQTRYSTISLFFQRFSQKTLFNMAALDLKGSCDFFVYPLCKLTAVKSDEVAKMIFLKLWFYSIAQNNLSENVHTQKKIPAL